MPYVGIFIMKNAKMIKMMTVETVMNKKQMMKEHFYGLFWDIPGLNLKR